MTEKREIRMLGLIATIIWLAASGALFVAGANATNAAGTETCFSDWVEVDEVVRENGLTPAREMRVTAPQKVSGRIVKMLLCRSDEAYFYRLFVENDGKIETTQLDARPARD